MKCPTCLTETTISKKDKRSSNMICDHCGEDIEDLEANRMMGVEFVGDGYQSSGDNWSKFPSWYCLKFFDTYDERIAHDKKYHNIGDLQMGMIPSGGDPDFEVTCN